VLLLLLLLLKLLLSTPPTPRAATRNRLKINLLFGFHQ